MQTPGSHTGGQRRLALHALAHCRIEQVFHGTILPSPSWGTLIPGGRTPAPEKAPAGTWSCCVSRPRQNDATAAFKFVKTSMNMLKPLLSKEMVEAFDGLRSVRLGDLYVTAWIPCRISSALVSGLPWRN